MPIALAQKVQTYMGEAFAAKDAIACTLQLAMFLVGAVGWENAAQVLQLDPESMKRREVFKVGIVVNLKLLAALLLDCWMIVWR